MSQEPSETSLTARPLRPRGRYSIGAAFYRGRYPVEARRLPSCAMLELAAATDPAWAPRALARLDELLVDHAHCEKKAAGTAVQLLFRYPQHAVLLGAALALAREELVHFEQVLALLAERGARASRRQRPSPYAGRLRARERAARARAAARHACSAAR